jgi:hypothetical protein
MAYYLALQPIVQQQQQQINGFPQQYSQYPPKQHYPVGFTGAMLYNQQAAAYPSAPTVSTSSTAATTKRKAPAKRSSANKATVSSKDSAMPPPPLSLMQKGDGVKTNDDDVMPPPPQSGLEAQLSRQVIDNALADMQNKPPPHTEPPSEAFSNSYSLGGGDENPVDVHDESFDRAAIERRKKWVTAASAICLVGACTIYALNFPLPSIQIPSFDIVGTIGQFGRNDKVPCFFSSSFDGQPADESHCPHGGAPCPEGGVCRLGKLLKCQSDYQQINRTKNGCEATPEYKLIESKLHKMLVTESIKQRGCKQTDEMPIFLYSDLQDKFPDVLVELNPYLIAMLFQNGYPIELGEDPNHLGEHGVTIGLPDNYELTLPMHCRFRESLADGAKWILHEIGSFFVEVTYSSFSYFGLIVSAYPVASVLGFLVLALIVMIRKISATKARLKLDTANLCHETYKFLQDNPNTQYQVLQVRDQIVRNMFPDCSKYQRRYLIENVWPRVVLDIKKDNCVKKSEIIVDGKNGKMRRDVWTWVLPTSTNKTTSFASDKKDQ